MGSVKEEEKAGSTQASEKTVVLLNQYTPTVPKGRFRQKLANGGRMLSLKFHRAMTSDDVRQKIKQAFGASTFFYLECDQTGHHLVRAADQSLAGEDAVERKGALYLCEKFPEVCLWAKFCVSIAFPSLYQTTISTGSHGVSQ